MNLHIDWGLALTIAVGIVLWRVFTNVLRLILKGIDRFLGVD